MSHMSKFVAAIIGFVVMTMVVSRQLFLLTSEQSGLSGSGGRSHLWLAAGAGMTACVAGGLMFYFFSRHEDSKWSEVEMIPTGFTGIPLNPSNSPPPAPFDAVAFGLANPWLSKGQADDEMPIKRLRRRQL